MALSVSPPRCAGCGSYSSDVLGWVAYTADGYYHTACHAEHNAPLCILTPEDRGGRYLLVRQSDPPREASISAGSAHALEELGIPVGPQLVAGPAVLSLRSRPDWKPNPADFALGTLSAKAKRLLFGALACEAEHAEHKRRLRAAIKAFGGDPK